MSLVLHVCNVARAGKHVTPKLAALMIGACGRGDAHLRRIRDGAAPRPRLPAHFEITLAKLRDAGSANCSRRRDLEERCTPVPFWNEANHASLGTA